MIYIIRLFFDFTYISVLNHLLRCPNTEMYVNEISTRATISPYATFALQLRCPHIVYFRFRPRCSAPADRYRTANDANECPRTPAFRVYPHFAAAGTIFREIPCGTTTSESHFCLRYWNATGFCASSLISNLLTTFVNETRKPGFGA